MAITKEQWLKAQKKALDLYEKAHIVLTAAEKNSLEIADFGLADLDTFGLEIVTYVNTERCCAKEMVLFPGQTCPEHRHPPVAGEPGKEETFRCRYGLVYVYIEGVPTPSIKARIPKGKENCFTVKHEIILHPGEQYTLQPNTLHWFQAGPEGAIVSEFSTKSRDESDIFTDTAIHRTPIVQ
jgi:D-lyxose ketol-isomerase